MRQCAPQRASSRHGALLEQFFGARPAGSGGVMEAFAGNPNQAGRAEAPSVRAGRFTPAATKSDAPPCAYGGKAIEDAWAADIPVTYRFLHRENGWWYLQATARLPPPGTVAPDVSELPTSCHYPQP